MVWKMFSVIAGVSSFYAISIGVSGADAGGVGIIVGNLGAFFVAMTVYHYIVSLRRDLRPAEEQHPSPTTAARETRA